MAILAVFNLDNYDTLEEAQNAGALYQCNIETQSTDNKGIKDIINTINVVNKMISYDNNTAAFIKDDGAEWLDLTSIVKGL